MQAFVCTKAFVWSGHQEVYRRVSSHRHTVQKERTMYVMLGGSTPVLLEKRVPVQSSNCLSHITHCHTEQKADMNEYDHT